MHICIHVCAHTCSAPECLNGTFAQFKALIPICLKICGGYIKNRDQAQGDISVNKALACNHGEFSWMPRTPVKEKVGMEVCVSFQSQGSKDRQIPSLVYLKSSRLVRDPVLNKGNDTTL